MSDESNMSDGPGGPGDLPPTEPVPVDPNLAAASAGAAVPPEPHWYDNRAAVAALIALGLVAIFLLIGWLVWWSDDDDAALVVDGSTIPTVVTSLPLETTVPETTVPETTVPETTVPETTPPTTVPETTVPETTPPTTVPETTVPETTPPTTTIPEIVVPEGGSIWDIIDTNDDLSRARELVEIANLSDALGTTDPLTVFVPTNDAIDAYEADGADLTDPGVVASLLFAHTSPARLDAAAVLASTEIATIGNDPLVVDADAQTVNGANLVLTDIEGSNGFVHIVDKVLTP